MNPLLEEYFKRDLTEEEEARLGEILQASPEEALLFAQGMAALYLELGLPEPVWPDKPMKYPGNLVKPVKHFPWIVISVLLLILLLFSLFKLNTIKEPLPVPSAPPHPKALIRKIIKAVHPMPPAPIASRVPAPPPNRYQEISATVDMPQSGLATVKVFDPAGNVIRILFAGILPSGPQTFIWDGKTNQGLTSSPGLYTIEVRSGQTLMKKQVKLQQ